MARAMSRKSPLDDPEVAAFAWARFRRLMRWMMLVTLTLVYGALAVVEVGLLFKYTRGGVPSAMPELVAPTPTVEERKQADDVLGFAY